MSWHGKPGAGKQGGGKPGGKPIRDNISGFRPRQRSLSEEGEIGQEEGEILSSSTSTAVNSGALSMSDTPWTSHSSASLSARGNNNDVSGSGGHSLSGPPPHRGERSTSGGLGQSATPNNTTNSTCLNLGNTSVPRRSSRAGSRPNAGPPRGQSTFHRRASNAVVGSRHPSFGGLSGGAAATTGTGASGTANGATGKNSGATSGGGPLSSFSEQKAGLKPSIPVSSARAHSVPGFRSNSGGGTDTRGVIAVSSNTSGPQSRPTDPRMRAAALTPASKNATRMEESNLKASILQRQGSFSSLDRRGSFDQPERENRDRATRDRSVALPNSPPPIYYPKPPPNPSVAVGHHSELLPSPLHPKVPTLPHLKPTAPPQRMGSYSSLADSNAKANDQNRDYDRDVDRDTYHSGQNTPADDRPRQDLRRGLPLVNPLSPAQRHRPLAFPCGGTTPVGGVGKKNQCTSSNSLNSAPLPPLTSPAATSTASFAAAAAAAAATPLPRALILPQSMPPQRPNFHRKDPRFAKHLQQQLQHQHQHLDDSALMGMLNSEGHARGMALRRAGSSDGADCKSKDASIQTRTLERTGSSSMAMIGDKQVRATRSSWNCGGGLASGEGLPPRSQSHGSTGDAKEASQRRRMSYPASPSQHRDVLGVGGKPEDGVDSFGRAPRDWLKDPSIKVPHGRSNSSATPQSPRNSRKSFASLAHAAPPPFQPSTGQDHTNPMPRRTSFSGQLHHSQVKDDSKALYPAQAAQAKQAINLMEIPKKQRAQLNTAALGESNVVARADGAVQSLQELLQTGTKNASSTGDPSIPGSLPLPSKHLIMKAMATLDTKIKQREKDCALVEGKIEAAQEEEEEARKEREETQRLELMESEKQYLQERRQEREQEHESKMKEWLEEKRQALGQEMHEAKELVAQKIQEAQEEEKKRLESEMSEQVQKASNMINKDIAKVRREYDRATHAAFKSQAKAQAVQEEYLASVKKAEEREIEGESSKKKAVSPNDLVRSILAENQRRAAEGHMLSQKIAMRQTVPSVAPSADFPNWADPKFKLSCAEWLRRAAKVTGPANALYTEPSRAPFFEHYQKMFKSIAPLVKEYIGQKKRKLESHWSDLAEEYDYRKRKYNKHLMMQRRRRKQSNSNSSRASFASRQSILGGKTNSSNTVSSAAVSPSNILAGRSGNPYRRARRGNEVRSEYEQEQIIAELAAKEAMEKRIAFGGCKPTPQISPLEQSLTARYVNNLEAQRVDPVALEEDSRITKVWTDMEKCIFLDRFLQHPKDFRKIASFLRNKTTKDCVAFYYDSKQAVPYKAALKEHLMRRKRRGDYPVWDATIQAAISTGAVITAGCSGLKPLVFTLPENDGTFHTRDLHPLQRGTFDKATAAVDDVNDFDEEDLEVPCKSKSGRPSLRYKREPYFTLAKKEKVFLRTKTKGSSLALTASPIPLKKPKIVAEDVPEPVPAPTKAPVTSESEKATPTRKAPQKWTGDEKKVFVETLEKYGRNWPALAAAVGTKTINQIKNYYYDYKKQVGKFRGEKYKKQDSSSLSKPNKEEHPKEQLKRDVVEENVEPAPPAPSLDEDKRGTKATTSSSEGSRAKKEQEQQLEQLREEQRLVQEELEQRQEAARQQKLENEKQRQLRMEEEDEQKKQEEHRQRLIEQQQGQHRLRQEALAKRIQQQQHQQQQLQQQQEEQQRHQRQQQQHGQHQRLLEHHKEQQRRHHALVLQQQQQQQQQRQQRQLQQLINQQQGQQQLHASQQQQLQQRLQQRQPQPSRVESRDSGGASGDLAELWAQQQAALSQQHHHNQQQTGGNLSVDEARRLLQHHSHNHHQQVLSNLLPWLQASQAGQALQSHGPGNPNGSQEWADATSQMQNLMALRQQQTGGSHGHSHGQGVSATAPSTSQLRSLALAGLSGLSASSFLDGGDGQHQQQRPARPVNEDNDLALAQRLLAYQQQQQQQQHQQQHLGGVQGADAQALDALGLLARSPPRSGDDNGNSGGYGSVKKASH